MTHVDSGVRCLVAHPPGHGQCLRCAQCHHFIPPSQWMQPCPGTAATVVLVVGPFGSLHGGARE